MSYRLYLEQNVFDAALDRIRWLFDEFEHIVINMSGGKDSTVIMHLALIVAEEKGRLPLRVVFLDQEAEWDATIQYIRSIRYDPRLQFDWLQIPFRIFNAASQREQWLHCWQEGGDWIRPKEPDSIHTNVYGTDRFAKLLDAYLHTTSPAPACDIAGVRAQESPARARGLTSYATYKHATWGSKSDKKAGYYTFYPIYDWEISDVWKAIHDNGWTYNRLYDYMYQYGRPIQNMRVSNINHETALKDLFFLQEIEPETWERITARMFGINTVGQLKEQFYVPKELPFMFDSWIEYRDYLLEHLIQDDGIREIMRNQFASNDLLFVPEAMERLVKTEIAAILVNDYHMTKLKTFHAANARYFIKRGKFSGRTRKANH